MTMASRGISDIQNKGTGSARKKASSHDPQGGECMKCGGKVKGYAKGGKIDGIAQRGHTRGSVV